METEKEVKKWYRRAWEYLTRRQQGSSVSFGVRGLFVAVLMLCGIGRIANVTSTTIWHAMMGEYDVGPIVRLDGLHWLATIAATVFAAVIGLRFGFRRWNSRPLGSRLPIRRLFVVLQDGARAYRHFLLLNLALITTYAIVADQSWNRVWVWWWNEGIAINWAAVYKFVMELMVFAVSLGLIWLAWKGVQRLRATYGRREPYQEAIRKWRRALEDEQRAHAQLREAQKVSGVGIATAIVFLRAIPKHRGDAQIGQAKHALQEALHGLIPDDTLRDAFLERARRKVEGEDQAQPSTATPSPTA